MTRDLTLVKLHFYGNTRSEISSRLNELRVPVYHPKVQIQIVRRSGILLALWLAGIFFAAREEEGRAFAGAWHDSYIVGVRTHD